MKKIYFASFLLISMVYGNQYSTAQQSFRLVPTNSSMTIEGTSSLHDWEMNVEKLSCLLNATVGNPSMSIQSVTFTAESSSISSHSSLMDSKAHDALKTKKYPEIRFRITSSLKVPVKDGSFQGIAEGELTLAGITRKISLPYKGKIAGKDNITITGSEKIDMTEYDIEPPTAMLGTLKTGKEVVISFSLDLKQLQTSMH